MSLSGWNKAFSEICSSASSLFPRAGLAHLLTLAGAAGVEPFPGVPSDQVPNPEWPIEKPYRNVLAIFFGSRSICSFRYIAIVRPIENGEVDQCLWTQLTKLAICADSVLEGATHVPQQIPAPRTAAHHWFPLGALDDGRGEGSRHNCVCRGEPQKRTRRRSQSLSSQDRRQGHHQLCCILGASEAD